MALEKQSDKPKPSDSPRFLFIYILLGFIIISVLNDYFFVSGKVENIPYSEFLRNIDQGKISSVSISQNSIVGEFTAEIKDKQGKDIRKQFHTVPTDDPTLIRRLEARGVIFRAEPKSTFLGTLLSWTLPFLIFFLLWSFFFKRMYGGATQGGIFGLTKSKAKVFVEKDVKTKFIDVAGVDEAKEELEEIVNFLRDPGKYTQLGGRAPKGVLLVGPPGTGKTLLARAMAGEAKVPFFSINGSEFVEMFVGLGAARVRELFQDARSQAPCIIFIDEIDALGKARALGMIGTGANDEKEQTLHQLLAEMDGFDSSQGVIILGATNRPEVLDPALMRAGRFDRQVLIPHPDQVGRVDILKVHVKKIKLDPAASLEQVAALTPGFSGADLANLINEAALIAVRRGAHFVSQADFTQAIERVVAGLEHKKRLMNPKEKQRIAYHEMGHTTVLLGLNLPEKIHKVSIVSRGLGALGYTLQRPTEDRYLVDYDELMAKIAVLLGGRASEAIFFSTVSTGAVDDLVKATEIARAMVTQYAMSEKIGLISLEQQNTTFLSPEAARAHAVSEKTAQEVDIEIKNILDHAFHMAMHTLKVNKQFIEAGAAQLLKVETLDEQEVASLWEKHKRGLLHEVPNAQFKVS